MSDQRKLPAHGSAAVLRRSKGRMTRPKNDGGHFPARQLHARSTLLFRHTDTLKNSLSRQLCQALNGYTEINQPLMILAAG